MRVRRLPVKPAANVPGSPCALASYICSFLLNRTHEPTQGTSGART